MPESRFQSKGIVIGPLYGLHERHTNHNTISSTGPNTAVATPEAQVSHRSQKRGFEMFFFFLHFVPGRQKISDSARPSALRRGNKVLKRVPLLRADFGKVVGLLIFGNKVTNFPTLIGRPASFLCQTTTVSWKVEMRRG